MIVEYRILQYRESPQRQEGKNFALVVRIDGEYQLRALGLRKGKPLDLAYYRAVAPKQSEWHWVFAEWVRWLQDLLCSGNVGNDGGDTVNQELDRVAALDRQIMVTPPYLEDWSAEDDWERVLWDLETRLLGMPGRPPDKPFAEWIEDVLQSSELMYRKGFARDLELEFIRPEGGHFITTFPYAVTEAPRVACKNIAFHGSRRLIQQKVNDAYLSFQRALESGFLEPGRCIVFTEAIPKAYQPYAAELEGVAHLLNVRQEGASKRLQEWVM
ncbi:hypothetical protein ACQAYK_03940 [Acidithiobacillus sp. AC3]